MSDCGDWCGATSRICCVEWREKAAAQVMVEARAELARHHAPGHPYGTSVGPHGAWMRWCKVDGCDWVERS